MKKKSLMLIVAPACALAWWLASAQSPPKPDGQAWRPFPCPASIAVREEVQAPPAGWTAGYEKTPHALAGVTFFDGPPEEMASLVYDKEFKEGTKRVLTWSFDPGPPHGTWIRCRYAGSSAVLDRKLPRGTSAARVTLDTQVHVDGYESIVSIELR